MRRTVSWLMIGAIFASSFGLGVAAADTITIGYRRYATGYDGAPNPPLPDRCWYIKPELRHPALNPSNTLDYNVYNRSRLIQGVGQNCPSTNPGGVPYDRPPEYLQVTGQFIMNGAGGGVCSYFNWIYNINTTADFAMGAPITNPGSTCGFGASRPYIVSGRAMRRLNGDYFYSGWWSTYPSHNF